MIPKKDLDKLTAFIEENTRTSESSGITYIDPKNFSKRILLKQNHVIFGRRGAGKSSLLKILEANNKNSKFVKNINLEDYKDISFPNILIHILQDLNKELQQQQKKQIKWYQVLKKYKSRKVFKLMRQSVGILKSLIPNPDSYSEKVRRKTDKTSETGFQFTPGKAGVSGKDYNSEELEITVEILKDKLISVRNALPSIKKALKKFNKISNGKPIFLILDDFYFLPKNIQVFFIDFFHRLSKDTKLFLKVATIKHRSKLYIQTKETYYGTELGHDIQELDLDYNLDQFDNLKSFMTALFIKCCELANVKIEMNQLFTDNAFIQLCIASGGVPRDFLTLLVKVTSHYSLSDGKRIGKLVVIEEAIQNISNKYNSLKTDSAEEKDILESFLNEIRKQIVISKKTNMFLISNNDLDLNPKIKQAIKELVDLRMIHLVEPNTSASSGETGHRYSAYIVDTGLYPNNFQVGFSQRIPGYADKEGRKDEMRKSPKLNIEELKKLASN